MDDSFLDAGFLLDKRPGQNQPRRVENAKGNQFYNKFRENCMYVCNFLCNLEFNKTSDINYEYSFVGKYGNGY